MCITEVIRIYLWPPYFYGTALATIRTVGFSIPAFISDGRNQKKTFAYVDMF